ncbi:tyrosine-type recombinase/integrase [Sporolactobacillus sp. CQH2019]|uniref:tyrosine-type recombinase/integrase n=1 Tax=Sporolactobacillus sp. CQH2019 TaxID=3023512 RepID=UPI0023682D8B|nr:tyrosine-type recombinase/integrase [Sporolactobacillus sp. CQH2019]MDD9150556.1 tyrosine-type recombinase/integrase [Sporolactobacillus sp. CQH2019]
MKKWKTIQKERLLAYGIAQERIQYVVSRVDLRPLRLAEPNETLDKFIKDNPDFTKITVHGFRHTFATALYEAGVSVKTAQKFLDHRRMETTMNIYTHVAKRVKMNEADKYEEHMKMLKQNR